MKDAHDLDKSLIDLSVENKVLSYFILSVSIAYIPAITPAPMIRG